MEYKLDPTGIYTTQKISMFPRKEEAQGTYGRPDMLPVIPFMKK